MVTYRRHGDRAEIIAIANRSHRVHEYLEVFRVSGDPEDVRDAQRDLAESKHVQITATEPQTIVVIPSIRKAFTFLNYRVRQLRDEPRTRTKR